MNKWRHDLVRSRGPRIVHVVPVDDLKTHYEVCDGQPQTSSCWCAPVINRHELRDGVAFVVVHQSMDGRELIERYGVQ